MASRYCCVEVVNYCIHSSSTTARCNCLIIMLPANYLPGPLTAVARCTERFHAYAAASSYSIILQSILDAIEWPLPCDAIYRLEVIGSPPPQRTAVVIEHTAAYIRTYKPYWTHTSYTAILPVCEVSHILRSALCRTLLFLSRL